MTISAVYERLAHIAASEFADIVLNTRLLYLPTGDLLKLRLDMVDESILDVWISPSGRYSYHWERRHTSHGDLYRFDNAPHKRWRHLESFPYHLHNGTDQTTVASRLSLDPDQALRQVLTFARAKLSGSSA